MRQQRQHRRTILFPLLGVLTVIVVVAFVYISYTADGGLPFTSSYLLNLRVPNADRLIATDEVRIGGVRIGQVASVSARVGPAGKSFALVGVALSPSVGALRADTVDEIESSSVLGQTYVDLIPGRTGHRLPSGSTLPLSDARTAVELTDLLDIFNASTARSIQATIGSLGTGLAGRGAALNEALAGLPRLLPAFGSVSRTLAAPGTDLAGFVRGLSEFASAVAPVASSLGGLTAGGATTLGALAAVRQALGRTIAAFPSAESAATTALSALQSPLTRLAALTVRLRAAGALLPATVARIDTTLGAGPPALVALTRFAPTLDASLMTLQRVSRISTTPGALRQLTAMLGALQPLLTALLPAQLDCNVLGLYGRNFSSAWGTLGTGIGPSYVVAGVVTPGALGESLQAAAPAPDLHINYLPHENAQECESGNEPFSATQPDLTNPAGNQSRSVPVTSPPAGVPQLAASAGLLTAPAGTPR